MFRRPEYTRQYKHFWEFGSCMNIFKISVQECVPYTHICQPYEVQQILRQTPDKYTKTLPIQLTAIVFLANRRYITLAAIISMQ